ncbi:T9SS type B sorting domain-containing protein [Winogradskyella echinorum]|uniref:T9SS type B sorting domain-containing protein n=1 Tax=Winogradskyella echinorum TaxID=538189 RepID=A0ABR6Y3I2_9FLAO|nr:choice-of-anchor L domain-containing protein [Winogradskyella echinorum]MBC3847260.1 T9SS type B sorting domain-containing protein [Winogradskyella echinorum]MBC5751608.1 T9SS type B sorting domain-containing protein [Winogradskyella echinorum]
MKKKNIYLFLFFCAYMCFTYAQQISTDNSQQPNQLIQNLVGDNCASASNITSSINGSVNNIMSYGSFDKGASNFPLDSGIVLSTGNVTSVGNDVISENLSDGEIDWGTDPDVENILGISQTLNATSIEFDFVSANNFVAFKYLFASDEYQQEYPCTFQDVFAILIKRAGTADPYVNIALVPDTNSYVTTNTIHPDISGFCEAENEDYFQGYNSGNTNFNGSTVVLNATSEIIPNVTYHIKFVIADHIDERFDSAVFIEAEGFGSSIDLGPDRSICGNDLTLDANINNATATYTWFLDGNEITGETNTTLEVNQSGTYNVEVTIPTTSGNCTLTDTIEIEIIPFQQAEPIEDILICDEAPGDGLYDFNFPLLKDDEIFDVLPSTNYTISYHLSEDDAQNNNNSINGLYQNTEETETIYVRIESLSGDCLQIGSFNIIVNISPNTFDVGLLDMCDGLLYDGVPINELSHYSFNIANYEFNRETQFYLTEEDAINNENEITLATQIIGEPPFIYAKVTDILNGCSSIIPVGFNYQNSIDLSVYDFVLSDCLDPQYYENTNTSPYYSDYNNLGVTHNLDVIIDEISEDYPNASVLFFGSYESAVADQFPFFFEEFPRMVTFTQPVTTIYIKVRGEGIPCPSITSVEVHKNVLFNILGPEKDVYRCDDSSNDGIVDFDLIDIEEEITEGYSDINVTFYATEEDRDNEVNPLDENVPFSATHGQSIYIASAFEDCTHRSKVMLNIHPAINVTPRTIEYCGNLNPNTNSTTIALSPLTDDVLEGLNINGSVEFYISQEDAENQENVLTGTYDITGDQEIFFVRVKNFFTGCFDISTLQVNITNTIQASNPDPIIVCDDDQDGISIVNLESVIPDLSNGSDDLSFTFFENYQDALNNNSPIVNPSSYETTTKTIYIRGEITNLECFTVFTFDVLIYNNPYLNTISDFINCEIDINNPSGFILANKDTEVINGQSGMQVFYFENETDAINKHNAIDKDLAYITSSNPQTIYVRLENEAENSCFAVAPMQLEIKQAPIYVEPTDVFECDVNSTGLVSTDLNEKVNEITNGATQDLNVSFHLTSLNADNGANEIPLNFTTTANPQLVFARVENVNSGCFEVSQFYINSLSLPEVNHNQSFEACADNYDTSIEWDLTLKEIEILDGRQYNIDFTYYRSETDLENNNNPILNPESYTNTSNPETVYVKIRNASTECYNVVALDLIINMPPEINDFETFNICENENNLVDLTEINEALLDNTYNILVSYHTSEGDAVASTNALNTNYNYTNTNESLFARVEYSTTNCYAVYPFQLVVEPLPIANQPNDLVACDDNTDGAFLFDLTSQNTAILDGQNPNDISVSYYNSQNNATENLSPLNTDYLAYNNEIIFVRVENNTTSCFDTTQFSIIVNPLPINAIEDQVICLNNLPLVVSAETGNSTDSYLWSTGVASSEIEIYDTGSYSVTITNAFGCEYTSTFNVTESESAVIDVVETIDFSDPNNITVTVNGIGNYLYQLNNLPVQTSNVFVNVPLGYNTIKVIDQNGCAQITREVMVIDAPKHMTPNSDGDFDTWHIVGVETLPGTIIHIFDRKGKLLKELGSNTSGWDGTYNGNKMPTGDYWYLATVTQNGKTFQVKGHFALRR